MFVQPVQLANGWPDTARSKLLTEASKKQNRHEDEFTLNLKYVNIDDVIYIVFFSFTANEAVRTTHPQPATLKPGQQGQTRKSHKARTTHPQPATLKPGQREQTRKLHKANERKHKQPALPVKVCRHKQPVSKLLHN
jgi:hypothetical protein